ncbi:MAG: protein kinase, partial [Candidatus Symbiothrix sp.]|nr:protein kinase [Candidatus Symbiothrix sp.]
MQLKEYTQFHSRYNLIRRLGSGGFSEVWLAEDTKADNLQVALKVYASAGGLDEEGVQMFSHEFSLLFDKSHSNLLKPTHFDDFDKRPYLVMPFCEQGSAQKLVGNITEAAAWKLLSDVASGLAYLHSRTPV